MLVFLTPRPASVRKAPLHPLPHTGDGICRGYGRPRAADGFRGRAHRRPAGRNGPPDSGAANTIFRSILSCLSLNFAKNRFSRKIGFRQKTSAFFRKTREISVFIAKKTALFFGKCSVFFHFFRKNIDFRVSTSRKRLPLLPKNKIHCAGAVNPNLSGVVFLGFRCCFG